MEWPVRRTLTPRHERERSRVTLQLSPKEKQAIDWLARLPACHRDKLPVIFRDLANSAARTIALELSGSKIRKLAELHAATTTPPPC